MCRTEGLGVKASAQGTPKANYLTNCIMTNNEELAERRETEEERKQKRKARSRPVPHAESSNSAQRRAEARPTEDKSIARLASMADELQTIAQCWRSYDERPNQTCIRMTRGNEYSKVHSGGI